VIHVLLADDHPLILRGLEEVLTADSEFRVVGAETDARKVLAAALRLRPDVLVIDYSMPERTGAEVVREVASRLPSTRALVLSMHSGPSYVSEALTSGARGYVLKCADTEEIMQAIRAVHGGELYLSAPLREGVEDLAHFATSAGDGGVATGREGLTPVRDELRRVPDESSAGTDSFLARDRLPARDDRPLGGDDTPGAGGDRAPLTKRELQVLGLVVVGHTSGEIAARLHIGRRTVESHRSSLMAKLGARNQIDLVREAVRRGLASLEDD
jgi:two-component system response regulator NreC